MNHFFNTTNETGEQLDIFERKAESQEDIVLGAFKNRNIGKNLSPEKIWDQCFDVSKTPLTSVRRALTNLTTKGLLIKTDKKVLGQFGRDSYTWKLNNEKR